MVKKEETKEVLNIEKDLEVIAAKEDISRTIGLKFYDKYNS